MPLLFSSDPDYLVLYAAVAAEADSFRAAVDRALAVRIAQAMSGKNPE